MVVADARPRFPGSLFAAAVVALVATRGGGSSTPARGSTLHAQVLRVVDGDTIQVRLDGGAVERVRYIGIDTPESVKPNTPVQCYAEKASHYNASLVDGPCGDAAPGRRAARSLRTAAGLRLHRSARSSTRELVARGYARTLTIPPNVATRTGSRAGATCARRPGVGLWRACG